MQDKSKRVRKFPQKFNSFLFQDSESKKLEKSTYSKKEKSPSNANTNTNTNKKRKIDDSENAENLLFFTKTKKRKIEEVVEEISIESTEESSADSIEDSDVEESTDQLGVDQSSESYIPSSIDRTDLVSVRVVDLLKHSGGRGLFAATDIAAGTCIGIYTGDLFSKEEFATFLEENPGTDKSYAMFFGDNVVDAQFNGNFTRYINCSDSQDNLEFKEGYLNYKRVIKVFATKDIKAGQQLLINYNTYDQKASKYYYFLNPEDSSLSAEQLRDQHAASFQQYKMPNALAQFNLKKNEIILTTGLGLVVLEDQSIAKAKPIHRKVDEVSLPFLKKGRGSSVVDFSKTDTFTPLMLACFRGQLANVNWLIKNGANLNQQQNHSGNCPLFLALEGYSKASSAKEKNNFIKIIELLIENQANLKAHDRNDKTFLHKAVSILSTKDFQKIIHLICKQKHINIAELFSYIDEDNNDILTFCLQEKQLAKAGMLLAANHDYFHSYMFGESAIRSSNRKSFTNAIEEYSETELDELGELLSHKYLKIKPSLYTALGFKETEGKRFAL
ncbi:ankyrin repeat protein [Legionella massiliensis]|uniref:Ankyrin repeat protein n=1 Tax=Legionella massiliensis TaxID=1034943 RepID=A0A078KX29_9GAMM|nr:Dot/Icm T4SS effector AnkI/LegAS4 [Legionella massiliensis]CDZ77592.1 ankyrin repeat protein [Legionella massiliensis]CEE13330.1 Ankyrin repeats (3 copies) [Legionella massiliensis]